MTILLNSFRTAIYLVVILATWWVGVRLFDIPNYLLPPPGDGWQRLVTQPSLFVHHGTIAAIEIVLALILRSIIGFGTGIICWMSIRHERAIFPVLVVTQALPVFAIAPLLVTWFGYGLAPKLVMATLIVFLPVAVSTLNGLKRVHEAWQHQAIAMRATPGNGFIWIMVPAALATIAVGLRLAAVSAPIGAIVGIWAGEVEGLGFLMLRSNHRVEIDTVFAALFVF